MATDLLWKYSELVWGTRLLPNLDSFIFNTFNTFKFDFESTCSVEPGWGGFSKNMKIFLMVVTRLHGGAIS